MMFSHKFLKPTCVSSLSVSFYTHTYSKLHPCRICINKVTQILLTSCLIYSSICEWWYISSNIVIPPPPPRESNDILYHLEVTIKGSLCTHSFVLTI